MTTPGVGYRRPCLWSSSTVTACSSIAIGSLYVSRPEHLTAIGLPTTYDDCVRDFLGIAMSSSLELIRGAARPADPRRLAVPAERGGAGRPGSRARAGRRHRGSARCDPTSDAWRRVPATSRSKFRLRHTGCSYEQFAGHIYSGEDVEHGKPAPDLFLAAAASEQADPARCVVVEDSPAGVQAAGAARMPVLAYAAETPRERLADADRVFTDMTELPRLIEEILAADAAA